MTLRRKGQDWLWRIRWGVMAEFREWHRYVLVAVAGLVVLAAALLWVMSAHGANRVRPSALSSVEWPADFAMGPAADGCVPNESTVCLQSAQDSRTAAGKLADWLGVPRGQVTERRGGPGLDPSFVLMAHIRGERAVVNVSAHSVLRQDNKAVGVGSTTAVLLVP